MGHLLDEARSLKDAANEFINRTGAKPTAAVWAVEQCAAWLRNGNVNVERLRELQRNFKDAVQAGQ